VPADQTLGAGPLTLKASATSGLAVSFGTNTPAVCTVSGSTLTLVAAGTCTVTADQAGDDTYAAAPTVAGSFTVNKVFQFISFTSPGNQTLGAGPVALVATASSGLAVSFGTTTPAVCTVSGSTLTLVSAGTCTVQASQAGDATYAAAPTVSNSFTVSKAAQAIIFTSPGDQTLGSGPVALTAVASSGLSVSFSSTTPAVCTVSGADVTLVLDGTCTIAADQAGDGTYLAAPTVTVSFTVAPAAVELFANVGFEIASDANPANEGPAEAWLRAASGYSRSADARSGGFAAQLRSPAFNAAVMVQNSVDQGGRPALTPGTSPTLRFWAKGTAGATGNVLFALRYLDSTGNILANSQNQFFQNAINTSTWTEITYNLGVVPPGAAAAFIEFSQSIGPIGVGPAGEDWFEGLVLIDDLSLRE
jgi:hypothetical protein